MALKSLQRTRSGRKAIVVLSDGMENSSRVSFEELRRRLAQDDAVFYPITILNKDRQKEILERYIRESQDKEEDPYVENARSEPLRSGGGLSDSNRALEPALQRNRGKDVSGGRPVGPEGRVFQGCP